MKAMQPSDSVYKPGNEPCKTRPVQTLQGCIKTRANTYNLNANLQQLHESVHCQLMKKKYKIG